MKLTQLKLTQSMQLMALALGLTMLPNGLLPNSFNLIAQAQTELPSQASPPEASRQDASRPMPPPPLDLDRAAQKLGVTKAQLIEALGLPPNPPDRANREHPPGCMPPRPASEHDSSSSSR